MAESVNCISQHKWLFCSVSMTNNPSTYRPPLQYSTALYITLLQSITADHCTTILRRSLQCIALHLILWNICYGCDCYMWLQSMGLIRAVNTPVIHYHIFLHSVMQSYLLFISISKYNLFYNGPNNLRYVHDILYLFIRFYKKNNAIYPVCINVNP